MSHSPRIARQRRYDLGAVLDYIASYQRSNGGRSPSQRRIQSALGISAPSVVHNILHRLQYQQLISMTTFGRGCPAELALTDEGYSALSRWQHEHQVEVLS